ncbi:WD40-repeat-containing domain protein [Chlamydoabsidia padenii]|nr:WD40-repeat-containing domain protein [Chlamydoabsidia padenii]
MSQTPYAPNTSQGTIADIRGRVVYATNAEDSAFTTVLQEQQVQLYPSITTKSCDHHNPDHVDTVVEGFLKSAASAFLPFLQSRLGISNDNRLFSLLQTLSNHCANLIFTRQQQQQNLLPTDHHLFSDNAPSLRTLSWHPHREMLAVAHEDHRVYIYEYNLSENTWDTQILEHSYMADITSLDWKKFCRGTLAVGCRTGVCVWFLNNDPASNSYDFIPATTTSKLYHTMSNAYMHFFSTHGHQYISAVAWDPSLGSQTLAVASGVDSTLIMYDLLTFNHTPLKRNGKGNVLLRWSPDGSYLYVAGLNGKSRLWETQNWTNNEIKNPPGLWVKSACWSPDNRSLYYNMVGKEDIHMLFIQPQGLYDVKLLSTPPISVTTSDGNSSEVIGGVIKELGLDPNTGTRLAVSYEYCDLVALYSVKPMASPLTLNDGQEPTLLYVFSGYVRGMDVSNNMMVAEPMSNTRADHLSFMRSTTNGVVLATSWKNNKISFVSMNTI